MLEPDYILGPLHLTVHNRLTDLTRSADEFDQERLAVLAQREIPLLAAALREVLAEHRPDKRGRCPACRRKTLFGTTLFGTLFGRSGATPCRAYVAAQLRLGEGREAAPRTSHQKRRRRSPHFVA